MQFFWGVGGGVCAVDSCLWGCTGWIIHLQADEKRAGKVRSAEVEWPWFLLAAGHPAVAVVIIHTSQMAFPWASMKRTGQGLSCQVLPGPKNNSGPIRYLERERERESGLQEDFAELGDKKRVFRWKYSRGCVSCITHTLAFNHTHTCKKKRGFARISSKQTEKTFYLILTLENLGSMPWLPVTFIPSVVFLAMAQCCAHTAK